MYFRLDDGFVTRPAIAALSNADFRTFVRLLCVCTRHMSPAVTPAVSREVRGLGPARLARFVGLGLVDELEDGTHELTDGPTYFRIDLTAAERKRRSREKERRALGW